MCCSERKTAKKGIQYKLFISYKLIMQKGSPLIKIVLASAKSPFMLKLTCRHNYRKTFKLEVWTIHCLDRYFN